MQHALASEDLRPGVDVSARRKDRMVKKCRRFLARLTECGDPVAAAAAAGSSLAYFQTLRRREPAFAGEWAIAVMAAYERLEQALLRRTLAVLDTDAASGARAGKDDYALAMLLLARHRARTGETCARTGTADAAARGAGDAAMPAPRVSAADTDALIRQQLRLLAGPGGRAR